MALSADTRPRHKYLMPDGRPIMVIVDHGDRPKPMVDLELRKEDPLWEQAQKVSAGRRIVWCALAEGM